MNNRIIYSADRMITECMVTNRMTGVHTFKPAVHYKKNVKFKLLIAQTKGVNLSIVLS
jgi:hypothetical protein